MADGGETAVRREGPFWDALAGRAPAPPAARLLGWELVEVDPGAGTIAVSFTADERFLNPAELLDPDGTVVASAVATALVSIRSGSA